MSQPTGAIAQFERALAIDPRYGNAHLGLATAYDIQKRIPEAIEAYERGFQLGGTRVSRSILCYRYYHRAAYERAERCFQQILAGDPDDMDASHRLADVRRNLERQRVRSP
jgi:Tfp pilus assembly protein PilF